MRHRLGKAGDPLSPAPFELFFPHALVGQQRFNPAEVISAVLTFGRSQYFGEQLLSALLTLDRVHCDRSDDRLSHRYFDLPISVVDADRPIGLFADDALQSLTTEGRGLVPGAFRPAMAIT